MFSGLKSRCLVQEILVSTNPKQLRTITLANLLHGPFGARQYLLAPSLFNRQAVMVWAAPGLGKTFFTLSMALAIAGAGEFLGWKSPDKRRVLIIDGEMDLQDLRDRLAGLAEGMKGLDVKA